MYFLPKRIEKKGNNSWIKPGYDILLEPQPNFQKIKFSFSEKATKIYAVFLIVWKYT